MLLANDHLVTDLAINFKCSNKGKTMETLDATILVVDDDPTGQMALESLLIGQGYILQFAATGEEAYTKTVLLKPDLILLDVMMPGMDGFETCQRIRNNPTVGQVPIIMVTALDDQDSRLQGIKAGADDFITKPYNRAELRARISTIIRLNRYRRLYEQSVQLEWVVETATDGYIRLDAQDRIEFINSKAKVYLGLESNEFKDTTFLQLVQEQYQCVPDETWMGWPSTTQGEAMRPRYLVRSETQNVPALWLSVNVLNFPGESDLRHGCLVQLRDVTELATNQMDMRNFYSAVSHKLRTPLIYVVSSLELLTDPHTETSLSQITEFTQIALRGAYQLRTSINDVLDYGQVRALTYTSSPFPLSQLTDLIANTQETLKINPVDLSLPESLQEQYLGLPRQGVELILWELLENSTKFHPTQSPTVMIAVVPVSSKMVTLKISDNGGHLTPEQIMQAWTPYFQGEKHFTGQVPGMGLGLSTIATLVWNVGGNCRIYNQAGGPGVVVEIMLPLKAG